MLKIENLSLAYDESILEDVNLTFKPGEISVLTGTSGSGKSSLLKIINGVIPYFEPAKISDKIVYNNRNLLDLDMTERSNTVATVFQNPKTQFYAVNSTDELAFALENRNLSPEAIVKRITQFTQLLEMEDLLHRDIFALSGGEKQLLAITSVACMDNDIYLFDEPSSSLDREAISRFKNVLIKLKEMGKIVIIAEHRLYYLKDLMNQLIIIEDKKVNTYSIADITNNIIKSHNLRQLDEISKAELIECLPYQKHSKKSQTIVSTADLICQNYRYKHKDSREKDIP